MIIQLHYFLDFGDSSLEDQMSSYLVNEIGGRKGWQCVECGVRGLKGDVKRHVEAKHLVNTQVACNICGKVYKNSHSLGSHMYLVHKENYNNY